MLDSVRPAWPMELLGFSQMIWEVETEDVFCLPVGAWVALWVDLFEEKVGVGQVSSYRGLCLET